MKITRTKKILACMADANDACSFYRGSGPLSHLRKNYENIHVEFKKEVSIGDVRSSDIVFMLRPCTDSQKQVCDMACNYGVPVWVDFDDDLWRLMSDNPSYLFYSKKDVQQNMNWVIRHASICTVTTESLKEKLSLTAHDIRVIPNAYDPILDKQIDKVKTEVNKDVVLWRGTGTHDRDVQSVMEQLKRVSAKNQTVFAFLGHNPWFVTEDMPKAVHIPPLDIINYHKAIQGMKPSMFMVPLADNVFNKSKSPIAAIEGAYAGAVTLARNWEQWSSIDGVITYDDEADFEGKLQDMISMGPQDRAELAKRSWAHIQQHLHLDVVNKMRDIIVRDYT
jgi:hypothetical protein